EEPIVNNPPVKDVQTEAAAEPETAEKEVGQTEEREEAETTAPATVTTQASRLRKITFQLRYTTVLGESLWVTGSHPLLGNDSLENVFPLSYLNNEFWVGTLELPENETITGDIPYHYFL